jgi:hypothetical protein
MTENAFFASLANPYWVKSPTTWSLNGITLGHYVKAYKPGCANLVWLAATTMEQPTKNAVLRQVIDTISFSIQGHPIEHWAATGSLELFHDTIKDLKLPRKAAWLKNATTKALGLALV